MSNLAFSFLDQYLAEQSQATFEKMNKRKLSKYRD